MTNAHDQAGFSRGINAEQGAEEFRSNGKEQGVAPSGGNKFFQQIRRWQLQPFRGVYAAANGAEEWPLEVNAQDFRAGVSRLVLQRDVAGNALGALADVLRTGRDRSCDIRGGAVSGDGFGDGPERVFGAFHDVAATGAVDMDVQKAGSRNLVGGADLARTSGQGDAAARSDGLDDAVANQDSGIAKFRRGSEGAANVEKSRGHG